MLAAAGALGGGWYYLYGVLLLCAMLGTALSCAVALRHYCMVRFSTMANRRFSFVLLLAIPAWLCSLFGFGKLIGTVYPICGSTGCTGPAGVAAPSLHPSRAKVAATAFSWAEFMPFTGYGRRSGRRSAPPPQTLPVCFAPRGETACGRTFLLRLARLFPAIHP